MAKKRKAQKKKFKKQAISTQKPQSVVTKEAVVSSSGSTVSAKPKRELTTSGFEYVGHEIRHTLIVMGGILVSYAVLWYLFTHTSIGPAVYRLIKL